MPMNALRGLGHSICASSCLLIETRVLNALTRNLPGMLAEHDVPGMQCALCVGTRPVRSIACGLAETLNNTPLTCETRFLAASLSKPITALVFLELAAQHRIDLDRPISMLAGEDFCDSLHEGAGALTCRELLMHTAQVPHFDSAMYTVDQLCESEIMRLRFERSTRRQYFDAAIDTTKHSRTYTGRGYAILQAVAERHFGQTFDQIARWALFDHIGSDCSFDPRAACSPTVARDHDGESTTCLPQLWTPAVASSGLVASAGELAMVMRYALRQRRRIPLGDLFVRPTGSSAPYTCGLHLKKDHDEQILDHGAARIGMRGVLKVIPAAGMVLVMLANGSKGVEVSRTFVGLAEELGRARISLWGTMKNY